MGGIQVAQASACGGSVGTRAARASQDPMEPHRLKSVLLNQLARQSREPMNHYVRLELPRIENAFRITLHPHRAQAAGLGTDHVERVARDEPDHFSWCVQFSHQVLIHGGVRLERANSVHAYNLAKARQDSRMIERCANGALS